MEDKKLNSLEYQVEVENSRRGHSTLALPLAAVGLLTGIVNSFGTGLKLAKGVDIQPRGVADIVFSQATGFLFTTLAGSSFSYRKRDLLIAPGVYIGVQAIAGGIGYAIGHYF
jgi:hypothetical protein